MKESLTHVCLANFYTVWHKTQVISDHSMQSFKFNLWSISSSAWLNCNITLNFNFNITLLLKQLSTYYVPNFAENSCNGWVSETAAVIAISNNKTTNKLGPRIAKTKALNRYTSRHTSRHKIYVKSNIKVYIIIYVTSNYSKDLVI